MRLPLQLTLLGLPVLLLTGCPAEAPAERKTTKSLLPQAGPPAETLLGEFRLVLGNTPRTPKDWRDPKARWCNLTMARGADTTLVAGVHRPEDGDHGEGETTLKSVALSHTGRLQIEISRRFSLSATERHTETWSLSGYMRPLEPGRPSSEDEERVEEEDEWRAEGDVKIEGEASVALAIETYDEELDEWTPGKRSYAFRFTALPFGEEDEEEPWAGEDPFPAEEPETLNLATERKRLKRLRKKGKKIHLNNVPVELADEVRTKYE